MLLVTVLRSSRSPILGAIALLVRGHSLVMQLPDARTGHAALDLPPLAPSIHAVTIRFGGDATLAPSTARARIT
jgi:hypothetical protein